MAKNLEEKLREKFREELATKDDIYDIKVEIEKIRAEISQVRAEIERSKSEILKWVVGLFLAQTTFVTGLVLAILKLFVKG
jgi:outer membrane protein TolC